MRVNRLAIPCGRFPARRPRLPAHPGQGLANPHTVSVVFTSMPNDTSSPPAVIPDLIRNLIHRQRTTFLIVASRHCEEERRSNLVKKLFIWIASFLAMTDNPQGALIRETWMRYMPLAFPSTASVGMRCKQACHPYVGTCVGMEIYDST